jgi:hypothetical protein
MLNDLTFAPSATPSASPVSKALSASPLRSPSKSPSLSPMRSPSSQPSFFPEGPSIMQPLNPNDAFDPYEYDNSPSQGNNYNRLPTSKPTSKPVDLYTTEEVDSMPAVNPVNMYVPKNHQFCGSSFQDAVDHCSLQTHCPDKTCLTGQTCYSYLDEFSGVLHCNASKMNESTPTNSYDYPSRRPTLRPTMQQTRPRPLPTQSPVKIVNGLCATSIEELGAPFQKAQECSNVNPCPGDLICFHDDEFESHTIKPTTSPSTTTVGSPDRPEFGIDNNVGVEAESGAALCPGIYTGWVVKENCQQFYWCNNGDADAVLACEDGYRFDVDLVTCIVADEVDCDTGREENHDANELPTTTRPTITMSTPPSLAPSSTNSIVTISALSYGKESQSPTVVKEGTATTSPTANDYWSQWMTYTRQPFGSASRLRSTTSLMLLMMLSASLSSLW